MSLRSGQRKAKSKKQGRTVIMGDDKKGRQNFRVLSMSSTTCSILLIPLHWH